MKTSKTYLEEATRELGGLDTVGVSTQAAANLALIKAMKDFLDEIPFSFDNDGCVYVNIEDHNYDR